MQYCSHCHKTFSSQTQFCPEDGARLETRTEFDVGMVVRDKYKILEVLGEGGMGRVYKVKDLYFKYGRNLGAMKVPSAELASNPSYLERFIDEAAKARALDHPNIVRIENVDKTESGVPFLVMELVEGLPLRTWIKHQGSFEWRQAATIAREIALALAAAHHEGLVHCDIKPENILSTSRDQPTPLKVTDFGLAKATDALRSRLTQVRGSTWDGSTVAGSIDYMSPEQTISRDRVTEASDIYSLGIILYELLAGKTPFAHFREQEALIRAHREEQPASLRSVPGLPPPLVRLVESMLEKDASWRPTAREVIDNLDRILKAQASSPEQAATVRRETVIDTAAAQYAPATPPVAPVHESPLAELAHQQTTPISSFERPVQSGEKRSQPAPGRVKRFLGSSLSSRYKKILGITIALAAFALQADAILWNYRYILFEQHWLTLQHWLLLFVIFSVLILGITTVLVCSLALWKPRAGMWFGAFLAIVGFIIIATNIAYNGLPTRSELGEFSLEVTLCIWLPLIPTLFVLFIIRRDRRRNGSVDQPAYISEQSLPVSGAEHLVPGREELRQPVLAWQSKLILWAGVLAVACNLYNIHFQANLNAFFLSLILGASLSCFGLWKLSSMTPAAALLTGCSQVCLVLHFSHYFPPIFPGGISNLILIIMIPVLFSLPWALQNRLLPAAVRPLPRSVTRVAANLTIALLFTIPWFINSLYEAIQKLFGISVNFYYIGPAALGAALAILAGSSVRRWGTRSQQQRTTWPLEVLAGTWAATLPAMMYLRPYYSSLSYLDAMAVFIGGVLGMLLNRLIGRYFQRHNWLNRDAVDLLSTASAGLLASLICYLEYNVFMH
ncbi:MAG: protein kinase [Terracidiphilus sp.]|jgi:serine/threonine protein kinase